MENEPGVANGGLRKLRNISGYNMWHAEFLRSQDSKSHVTLAEENAESARRWNTLSLDQKNRYRDEAASSSVHFKKHNGKHELSRVLKHLEGISEHANLVPGLVAVSGGNHFVGGSRRGCQFLRECGTYVPYSFLGYLSSDQDSDIPQQQVKHRLWMIKTL